MKSERVRVIGSRIAGVFGGVRPMDLRTIVVPPAWRVVVLAPHPDDFEQFAVTLRWLGDNGNTIALGVVTSGASGVEDGYRGAVTLAAKAAIREEEQLDGCRRFGLPAPSLTFLRLPDDAAGHVANDPTNHASIRRYLAAERPDLVVLPHGHDPNLDHRRTYDLFRQAAADTRLRGVAWLGRDPKTVAMRVGLCVPFDEDAARWKGEVLRAHQSQHWRNLNTRGHGFDERILSVNRQAASELGVAEPYAEVFELETFGGAELAGLCDPLPSGGGSENRP